MEIPSNSMCESRNKCLNLINQWQSCAMICSNDNNLVYCCVIIFYHIRSDCTCCICCTPFPLHMLDGLTVSDFVLVTCSSLFWRSPTITVCYSLSKETKIASFSQSKDSGAATKTSCFFRVICLRPKTTSFQQKLNGTLSTDP